MTRIHPTLPLGILCTVFAGSVFSGSVAHADVPAEYTGTPYMGAQTIPGRVELANLDNGGQGVAWDVDNNRMNYAPPLSGDSHRPGDLDLPYIGMTNRFLVDGTWNEDFWDDAAGGGRYPSDAMPHEFYMGAVHAGDWVRLTVNVEQAGTYNVSSNWACEKNPCGLSIWFNDGSGVADDPGQPLHGENKSGPVMFEGTGSYHVWRAYPNFTTVTLSAGMQLMTFLVEVADHLQYGHLVFDLVGGNPVGTGGAGGASAGGAGGANAGGASAGGANQAGVGGSPATGGNTATGGSPAGAGPGAAGASLGVGGSAGNASAVSGAGTTASAAGSGSGTPDVSTDSGCAFSPTSPGSRASAIAAILMLGATLLRRRRQQ